MENTNHKAKSEVVEDLPNQRSQELPLNPPEHLSLPMMDTRSDKRIFNKMKDEIIMLNEEVSKCKKNNQELRDMMDMERSEKQIREEKVLSDHLKEVLELKKRLEQTTSLLKDEKSKNQRLTTQNQRLERMLAKYRRPKSEQYKRRNTGIFSYLFGKPHRRNNHLPFIPNNSTKEPEKLSRITKKEEAASIKKNKEKQERNRRRKMERKRRELLEQQKRNRNKFKSEEELVTLANPDQLFLDVGPHLALRVREFDIWKTEELYTWLALLDISTIRNKIEVFEIYTSKDLVEYLNSHENDSQFYFNVPTQDQLKFFLHYEIMKELQKFSNGYIRVIDKLVKVLGAENIIFHEHLSNRRKYRLIEFSRMLCDEKSMISAFFNKKKSSRREDEEEEGEGEGEDENEGDDDIQLPSKLDLEIVILNRRVRKNSLLQMLDKNFDHPQIAANSALFRNTREVDDGLPLVFGLVVNKKIYLEWSEISLISPILFEDEEKRQTSKKSLSSRMMVVSCNTLETNVEENARSMTPQSTEASTEQNQEKKKRKKRRYIRLGKNYRRVFNGSQNIHVLMEAIDIFNKTKFFLPSMCNSYHFVQEVAEMLNWKINVTEEVVVKKYFACCSEIREDGVGYLRENIETI